MLPTSPARNLYCYHYRAYEARTTGAPGSYGKKHIPRWDGGRDSSGRNFKPVWPKLEAIATAQGVNLATLMEATFATANVHVPFPPTQVASVRGLTTCQQYRGVAASEAAIRLSCERHTFLMAAERVVRLQQLPTSMAAKQALVDSGNTLSPLFRYCASHSMGDAALTARFEAAAADELARSWFALTNGWKEFIPAEISQRAASI